jgi:hypothetical protein
MFFVDTTWFFRARINVGESKAARQISDQHDSIRPERQRATGRARALVRARIQTGSSRFAPGELILVLHCNAATRAPHRAIKRHGEPIV